MIGNKKKVISGWFNNTLTGQFSIEINKNFNNKKIYWYVDDSINRIDLRNQKQPKNKKSLDNRNKQIMHEPYRI